MPFISEQKQQERAEMYSNLANSRAGYLHALSLILEKYLDQDAVDEALEAASNRDFDKFCELTRFEILGEHHEKMEFKENKTVP